MIICSPKLARCSSCAESIWLYFLQRNCLGAFFFSSSLPFIVCGSRWKAGAMERNYPEYSEVKMGRQKRKPDSTENIYLYKKINSMDSEIIFTIEEAPEGGFTARAASESIFTEAETMDELR